MSWILVAAILAGPSVPAVAQLTPRQAFTQFAGELQTGSLIISQGDCLAVKIYSASAYTHVAAVVVHDGEASVYDATGGAGVRKQSLRDYFVCQGNHTLHFFHPCRPFSEKRAQCFEQHLESQLGRPYAILHHLTGERAAGLHCSEYVTDALIAAGTVRARQPSRVSPATLVEGILKADLYRQEGTVQPVPDSPERPASGGWCARLWFDTRQCTRACCGKLRGWFFCK
ncbi:MAG: hypothetical protein ACM3U2_22500 [Deltaproteobacteria bacterium]